MSGARADAPRVVCLGEPLVDLVATAPGSLETAPAFAKAAGGAPANVAVALRRLGLSSAFLGRVGDDAFGRFLARTLSDEGVDVRGLARDPVARTALAFVANDPDGERHFLFYRQPSADLRHSPADVEAVRPLLEGAAILHTGSLSRSDSPAREATERAEEIASAAGALLSFDANLRPALWPDEAAMREAALAGLRRAQLVKVAADELRWLSGRDDLVAGARALWHEGLRLCVVTEGAAGCRWLSARGAGRVAGLPARAVDATGAGDAFWAAVLAQLVDRPDLIEQPAALADALRFANAAGALAVETRGAIPALPRAAAVRARLAAVDATETQTRSQTRAERPSEASLPDRTRSSAPSS